MTTKYPMFGDIPTKKFARSVPMQIAANPKKAQSTSVSFEKLLVEKIDRTTAPQPDIARMSIVGAISK
jgi:hypothetical protein